MSSARSDSATQLLSQLGFIHDAVKSVLFGNFTTNSCNSYNGGIVFAIKDLGRFVIVRITADLSSVNVTKFPGFFLFFMHANIPRMGAV